MPDEARIWVAPDVCRSRLLVVLAVVEVPALCARARSGNPGITRRMSPEVAILIQVKVFLRMDGARSSEFKRTEAISGRSVLMVLTEKDDIRAAETGEEVIISDVSDDALERAATIIGGQATPVTLVYGTSIVGNCACPV